MNAAGGARFATGGDDGAVVLWTRGAVRLRRFHVGELVRAAQDPLGRPLTVAGSAAPDVVALGWLPADG